MLGNRLLTWFKTIGHPLAGQAAMVAGANYVAAALGLVTAVVSARLLGPGDYGLAALAIAYPSLIWSLAAVKSESVTIRYLSRFRTAGQSDMLASICKFGYGVDLLSSLTALGIVGATAWWVANALYHHPELAWLMLTYALCLPLRALASTSTAVLSSWEQFHWTAIGLLLEKIATMVLVVGLLLAGYGVSGLVVGAAVVQALAGVGLAIGAHSVLAGSGLRSWWGASLNGLADLKRELREFMGWSYITSTLSGLVEQLPLILLGRLRGPEEAGFFRLATTLVTIASYSEGALGRVSYPRLAAMWSRTNLADMRGPLLRWTALAGVPVTLCLLAIIPLLSLLVPLLFGDRYEGMVAGVQIMMGGAIVSGLFFWLYSSYYAAGWVRTWAQGYTAYTAGVLACSWWAISSWGFLGMAAVNGVMKATFTVVMAWLILAPESLNREAVSAARPGRS